MSSLRETMNQYNKHVCLFTVHKYENTPSYVPSTRKHGYQMVTPFLKPEDDVMSPY